MSHNFRYKYTCPSIDKHLSIARKEIFNVVSNIEDDSSLNDVKISIDESLNSFVDHIRDINIDMRYAADDQIAYLKQLNDKLNKMAWTNGEQN